MRRYSQDEEERIRAQRTVREWTRLGAARSGAGCRLEAELRVDAEAHERFPARGRSRCSPRSSSVRRSCSSSRSFGLRDRRPIARGSPACAALVCFAPRRDPRRPVPLLSIRRGRSAGGQRGRVPGLERQRRSRDPPLIAGSDRRRWIVAWSSAPPARFGVYRRFGFVYAAVGAMACAALIPFQLYRPDAAGHARGICWRRRCCVPVFVVVRSKRLRYGDDYPGDEYGLLQAAAWAGVYLALNLQIGWSVYWRPESDGWFYWFTYAMIWLLPIVGLRWSIREKDRALLDVSLAMALVTLVTNKPYLGWPRTRVGSDPARRLSDDGGARASALVGERARWRTERIHAGAACSARTARCSPLLRAALDGVSAGRAPRRRRPIRARQASTAAAPAAAAAARRSEIRIRRR